MSGRIQVSALLQVIGAAAGFLLVSVGVSMLSIPAGLITAGGLLLAGAVYGATRKEPTP